LKSDQLNDIELYYDDDISSSETETRNINSIDAQNLKEEEDETYEANNLKMFLF